MSDYRPYDRCDYRINDLLIGDGEPPGNQLLDEDGNPTKRSGDKCIQGLAALAAALDRYGPYFEPAHLEKAVWWLKGWKQHRSGSYRTLSAAADFRRAMDSLKNSAAFKRDGKLARRCSFVSHLFALLTGVCAALALNAWIVDSGWVGKVAWTMGTLSFAALTAGFRDAARDLWQQQDRRYFLQCLRQSRCTEDLLDAGLFSHHPKTMSVNSAEDQLAYRRAVREMQLQLADALYFDWDNRIREGWNERAEAYSWNWAKQAK